MSKVDAATYISNENSRPNTRKLYWNPVPVSINMNKLKNKINSTPVGELSRIKLIRTKDMTPTFESLHKNVRYFSNQKYFHSRKSSVDKNCFLPGQLRNHEYF